MSIPRVVVCDIELRLDRESHHEMDIRAGQCELWCNYREGILNYIDIKTNQATEHLFIPRQIEDWRTRKE